MAATPSPTASQSSVTEARPLSVAPKVNILPRPLAADQLPVGQLVAGSSKFNPSTLENRDYNDPGHATYKDVIFYESNTGRFTDSLGGLRLVPNAKLGHSVGIIEADEQRLRHFKDPCAALMKVLGDDGAKEWVLENAKNGQVGFVTAIREITNALYRPADLVDSGIDQLEVVKKGGFLNVDTKSKKDVVGVMVRRVAVDERGQFSLAEEIGTEFWN